MQALLSAGTHSPAWADTSTPWAGTLSLTADRTTVDANAPSALLTATLSNPLTSPYWVSIYDDTGGWIAQCYVGSTSCQTSVQPPTGGTRTYTAYVAQDLPRPGPPTNDVRATSTTRSP